MELIKKLFSFNGIMTVFAALALVVFSGDASASTATTNATGWAGVFQSGATTLNAFKTLVVVAAYAVGTFLFFLGLWFIYKDGKEEGRGHMKNGIIAMIIGALLLIFPKTVGWTVGSLGAAESAIGTPINTTF